MSSLAGTATLLPTHLSAAAPEHHNATATLTGAAMRAEMVQMLTQMVNPIWQNLAKGELRKNMPVEVRPGNPMPRAEVTHLEAIGRSLAGIMPWLCMVPSTPLPSEEEMARRQLKSWVMSGLAQMANTKSKDYISFSGDNQILVDAAFLAYAFMMPGAWTSIFEKLPELVQSHLIDGWLATRKITPYQNNWLLFSAMVELALKKAGETMLTNVVDEALNKHMAWYAGDGVYGDGPNFHADYYNSYVIHPFLDVIYKEYGGSATFEEHQPLRSKRYAQIQLRSIMPDGSFPVLGRSICYRCGAFHHLAWAAYNQSLPAEIPYGAVRKGLYLAQKATLKPANYSPDGWLLLGLNGHQPELAENYISTGSLYLASLAFLPLGLEPGHLFWTAEDAPLPNDVWSGSAPPAIDKAISN